LTYTKAEISIFSNSSHLERRTAEQKLTTLDKDLARNILPSMIPIHPVVLEKKFVLHISHGVAMLTYVPRW
jgi:hypothetical protein